MRRSAIPVLVWAAWLSVLTAVLWVWTSDPLPPTLFGAAALAVWLLGIGLLVRAARPRLRRALPDVSPALLSVVAGLVFLLNSLLLGLWLALIGAGFLLLGFGGVARELRAERKVS